MFGSRFMPCPTCGGSVERSTAANHQCDPDRVVNFRMFVLRDEIASFEPQFHAFLDSEHGRFETWLASRQLYRDRD